MQQVWKTPQIAPAQITQTEKKKVFTIVLYLDVTWQKSIIAVQSLSSKILKINVVAYFYIQIRRVLVNEATKRSRESHSSEKKN